jgi:hypothetical protein
MLMVSKTGSCRITFSLELEMDDILHSKKGSFPEISDFFQFQGMFNVPILPTTYIDATGGCIAVFSLGE